MLTTEIRNPSSTDKKSGIQYLEPGILIKFESRIQVPLTQTGIQYMESGIHCVESRIQDCIGFPYMGQSRFVLR